MPSQSADSFVSLRSGAESRDRQNQLIRGPGEKSALSKLQKLPE